MLNDIETVQQLRLEILRRKTLNDALMHQIKDDYSQLKVSLSPVNLIKNAFGNKAIATTLISSSALFGLMAIFKNSLLNKTTGIVRSALGFILPKVASKIASETSGTIFEKIREVLLKKAGTV